MKINIPYFFPRTIINVLVGVTLIGLATSCVPNRKIMYLQNDDLHKKVVKDSVVRSHEMTIVEYRIQPLDVLSINFETLSDENDAFDFLGKISPQQRGGNVGINIALTGIVVDSEGYVEYPVLGMVKLEGLSLFDAEKTLKQLASKYVPDVVVRVRMLNFRFTVLGEVNGEKTVSSTNTRVTVMEAIGLAGGFTDLADRRNVKVVRQRGLKSEIFYVDLLDEAMIESPFYFVQQNDVILVPPLRQRVLRRYVPANLTIISSVLSLGLIIFTLTQTQNNNQP